MTRQLRRMSRYGILGAYLPEFGRVMGQMQHDLFHAYTVDAHTLEVIKNARRFPDSRTTTSFRSQPRGAAAAQGRTAVYRRAVPRHRQGPGGDHSELGAVDAPTFARITACDEKDTALVVWLVRNHLLMSAVSQRKDISDPEVIQQFAEHVGDEEHLDYLFTLTVADINGTNPTLWNAWRGSLLRQLYTESTRRALRRGARQPGRQAGAGGAGAQDRGRHFLEAAGLHRSRNWTTCGRARGGLLPAGTHGGHRLAHRSSRRPSRSGQSAGHTAQQRRIQRRQHHTDSSSMRAAIPSCSPASARRWNNST